MAEIIECPQCQRKLRLHESDLGQTVQCPSCQNAFIATSPTQAAPPPRPRDDNPPVYRPVDDEPPPRPRYDSRPPRRYDDDDDDYPRRGRNRFGDGQRAHRGSTVQTLGIIALVLCFCQPVPALIMAIVAISLAVSDLSAMNRGDMDDSGRGQTKTGLTCAIIALVCFPMMVVACVGVMILSGK